MFFTDVIEGSCIHFFSILLCNSLMPWGSQSCPVLFIFVDCFHGFFCAYGEDFSPLIVPNITFFCFVALSLSVCCKFSSFFLHFFFIFFHRCVQYLKIPCVIYHENFFASEIFLFGDIVLSFCLAKDFHF